MNSDILTNLEIKKVLSVIVTAAGQQTTQIIDTVNYDALTFAIFGNLDNAHSLKSAQFSESDNADMSNSNALDESKIVGDPSFRIDGAIVSRYFAIETIGVISAKRYLTLTVSVTKSGTGPVGIQIITLANRLIVPQQ